MPRLKQITHSDTLAPLSHKRSEEERLCRQVAVGDRDPPWRQEHALADREAGAPRVCSRRSEKKNKYRSFGSAEKRFAQDDGPTEEIKETANLIRAVE